MSLKRAASAAAVAVLLLGGLFYLISEDQSESTAVEAINESTKGPIPEVAETPIETEPRPVVDELEPIKYEAGPPNTGQLDFILKRYQVESTEFTYLNDGHIQFEKGAKIKIDQRRTVSSESGLFYSTPDLRCFYGDLTITDGESDSDYTFRAVLVDSNGELLLLMDETYPIFELYQKLVDDPTLSARDLLDQSNQE